MAALGGVEKGLEGLYKNAPALPENAKKWIVNVAPWITLILGVLQLLAALALWRAGHVLTTYVNDYARITGIEPVKHTLGLAYWISLLLLVVVAVIYITAYKGLKERSKKKGWDLLFLVVFIDLVYGIVAAFDYYGGPGRLIGALVGAAISFYFLFQIKSYYNGHTVHHVEATPKS